MLSSHLPILFNPHLHGEPEYAFGRTVLQALLSMSPGFGTLGWRCHLADIPGQLDHPCCASFGLAITLAVCFGLAQLYVTVTSACTHWQCVFWLGSAICRRDIGMYVYLASLRGCGPCDCYKPFPI